MKKQKLICALLLVVLLLPMLSGCGFGGGDALVEYIEIETLEDGSTQVVVQYLDEDPKTFTVPVGVTAEKGDPGNGIDRVVIGEKVDGEQIVTLYYTDAAHYPPTEIKVRDGATVVSAVRDDRVDENGVAASFMVLTLSDGSTQEVLLPEGTPGVGIAKIERIDNVETGKMRIFFTDHTEEKPHFFECELPRGVGFTGRISTDYNAYRVNEEDQLERGLRINFELDSFKTELDEEGNLQYVTDEEGNKQHNWTIDGVFIPYPQNGASISRVESVPFTTDLENGGKQTGVKLEFYIPKLDDKGKPTYDEEGNLIEELLQGNHGVIYDGATIVDIVYKEESADGNPVFNIIMSDGRDPIPLEIPRAEAVGIKSVEIDNANTDNSLYALKITYTDPSIEPTKLAFPKNSAWHEGSFNPNLSGETQRKGNVGDYFFDQENGIIYKKETPTSWEPVVNFGVASVSVVFNINKANGEEWDKYVENTVLPSHTVNIAAGKSFAVTGNKIPIPKKDGYTFAGWYTIEALPVPEVTDGAFNSMTVIPKTETALNLYPVWVQNN